MSLRFFLTIAALGACFSMVAEPATNKTLELSNVKGRIREVSSDVSALAAEKSVQVEQLKKLEKQYGEQINALNDVKTEIRQKEQALQDIRSQFSAMQKEIQSQQQGLHGLVKAAYAMSTGHQNMSALFNQHDPALSGRMIIYYDYLSQARIKRLEAIVENLKVLKQLEVQSDTDAQLLQASLEKKLRETQAIQGLKDQREKLLAEIEHDYAIKHGELAQLMRNEQKLSALLSTLQDVRESETDRPLPSIKQETAAIRKIVPKEMQQKESRMTMSSLKAFSELQGQLPWPVQGAITERFGSRRFEATLDGTVIGAREGADIRAVADGRVVYADWLRGYGLMLIVDHGKGFMSLYAFNQSLYKTVGESIQAGDRVASVGRSGGRSQASLYFGIRRHGRPVDPEQWCRKPEKS